MKTPMFIFNFLASIASISGFFGLASDDLKNNYNLTIGCALCVMLISGYFTLTKLRKLNSSTLPDFDIENKDRNALRISFSFLLISMLIILASLMR